MAFLLLSIVLMANGCGSGPSQGPYTRVEQEVWREVNAGHRGSDGVSVQATLNTFAYEISRAYARAEREDLGQEQLEMDDYEPEEIAEELAVVDVQLGYVEQVTNGAAEAVEAFSTSDARAAVEASVSQALAGLASPQPSQACGSVELVQDGGEAVDSSQRG